MFFVFVFVFVSFFFFNFLPYTLLSIRIKFIILLQLDHNLNMDSTRFLVQTLFCLILTFQTLAWGISSLSSSVITRNHRRLKGSTFKSFSSVSLVECGLQCQRHPRCVSTNFRQTSILHETGGVCELNEQRAVTPIEGNEDLEYEEGAVYTQLRDTKVSQK